MKSVRGLQLDVQRTQADIAVARQILQLQTDEGFLRLQALYSSLVKSITNSICTRDFDGKLQQLGRLQGQKKAIERFCMAPSTMQKEIEGLSKRLNMLQTELSKALLQDQMYQEVRR